MTKPNKHAVHFSSVKHDYATPWPLFEALQLKYGTFDLDAAASKRNAKVKTFFSEGALEKEWHKTGKNIWLNPPYGREIGKWVRKAYEESSLGCQVVALLPARTDTRWFHDYVYRSNRVTLEFLKGRIKFGAAKTGAPFPSMIVVFGGEL